MSNNTISLTIGIIAEDGSKHTVRTNTYDLYRAEKYLGSLKLLEGKPSFAEMAVLAWSAARRQDIAGDDFEAWLQVVELEFESDEESDPKD